MKGRVLMVMVCVCIGICACTKIRLSESQDQDIVTTIKDTEIMAEDNAWHNDKNVIYLTKNS